MTRAAPTSLPTCPTRHPGVSSQIKTTFGMYGNKPFTRYYCGVCKSYASKQRHSDRRAAGLAGRLMPTARQPYGVLPSLCWVPPERVLVEGLRQ